MLLASMHDKLYVPSMLVVKDIHQTIGCLSSSAFLMCSMFPFTVVFIEKNLAAMLTLPMSVHLYPRVTKDKV